MKLFADENIHTRLVESLRAAGHDVVHASELGIGTEDHIWLDFANKQGRLLLTDDKDFGELVFRDKRVHSGVILLRLDRMPYQERIDLLETHWNVINAQPVGSFIVVTKNKIRIRRPADEW